MKGGLFGIENAHMFIQDGASSKEFSISPKGHGDKRPRTGKIPIFVQDFLEDL